MRVRKYILIFLVICVSPVNFIFAGDNSFGGNEIKLKLKDKAEFKNFLLKPSVNEKQKILDYDNFTLRKNRKMKPYKVDPVKMGILAAVGVGVFTGFHIYYSKTWWKDQRDYFKYAADGYYARNMDKASHIYTANFFTVASSIAYEWAGVSPTNALLYGALTSFVYETYIEINDGFAPNWGFDWGDMGANVFGAVYPFFQKLLQPLEHVNFKWSFQPKWLQQKTSGSQDDLLDDYTNMTFWLSVNPMIALPKSVTKARLYPNFLAIALGMSIQDASHVTGSQKAQVEWFLSLDWDINQLPGNSDFMKKLKKILNFYHFPAPAVRISPSGIWYGLYF